MRVDEGLGSSRLSENNSLATARTPTPHLICTAGGVTSSVKGWDIDPNIWLLGEGVVESGRGLGES